MQKFKEGRKYKN